MSHDIFISYSRRDTERMQQVRDTLLDAGLTVWTDEGITPGTESWKRSISDAITGCTSVVVLFSPDAAQSTWVNRELDFAELHNKKIYPLLVRGDEKASLPFGYTTFQFIDIRSDGTVVNGLQDLISILSKAYPEKNLSAKPCPKISQSEHSSDIVSIEEPLPSKPQKTNWRFFQSTQCIMFVPETFKIMEPSHENIARMFLLHETVENVENLMFQFIRDEDSLGGKIPASLPGTPRGVDMKRQHVFVDISGLSVLSGFINLLRFPIWNRDWIIGRIMRNRSFDNLTAYMKTYNAHEVGRRALTKHGAVIAILEHALDNYSISHYFVIPFRYELAIHLLFIAETARYQQDIELIEQIAQSVQLF